MDGPELFSGLNAIETTLQLLLHPRSPELDTKFLCGCAVSADENLLLLLSNSKIEVVEHGEDISEWVSVFLFWPSGWLLPASLRAILRDNSKVASRLLKQHFLGNALLS